jgi:hypothetical protein
MTVEQIHEDKALCSWFEGSKVSRQTFPLHALELDEEPGSVEPDAYRLPPEGGRRLELGGICPPGRDA